MRRSLAGLLACLLILSGCGKGKPPAPDVLKRKGEPDVVNVPADDAAMNAAIRKARETALAFAAALRSPKPGQDSFSVKMAFTDGERTEHMWLVPVTFDGTRFQGVLNNEPESVRGFTLGQKVSVAPSEISDWMYVENGRLVGGYTIRALRDRIPTNERKGFDADLPFRIE